MKKCRNVIVIPARYASTRFPGKPLAMLAGKPMILHTWEMAKRSSADLVLVATDHEGIFRAVEEAGGQAVMTSPEHPTGTDRIFEALREVDYEVAVNVQGDEPLIPTAVIDELIRVMEANRDCQMATVAMPGRRGEMADPNKVKVVCTASGRALYFSRALIPFLREGGAPAPVYHHWGIYAYRKEALRRFVELPASPLENCEKLEQLRALEAGMHIQVIISELSSIGVDTPEDLVRAEARLRDMGSVI